MDLTDQIASMFKMSKSLIRETIVKDIEKAEVDENGNLNVVFIYGVNTIIGKQSYTFKQDGTVESD